MRIQAQNGNWFEQKCFNCAHVSYLWNSSGYGTYVACGFKAKRANQNLTEYGHGCFRPDRSVLIVHGKDRAFLPGDPGFEEARKNHEPQIH